MIEEKGTRAAWVKEWKFKKKYIKKIVGLRVAFHIIYIIILLLFFSFSYV